MYVPLVHIDAFFNSTATFFCKSIGVYPIAHLNRNADLSFAVTCLIVVMNYRSKGAYIPLVATVFRVRSIIPAYCPPTYIHMYVHSDKMASNYMHATYWLTHMKCSFETLQVPKSTMAETSAWQFPIALMLLPVGIHLP